MHIEIKDGCIAVYDCYSVKDSIKEIQGRRWIPEDKSWRVPINTDSVKMLYLLGAELPHELLCMIKERNSTEAAVPETMPIKSKPYKHQLTGYALACESLGIFSDSIQKSCGFALYMEMGCGKSITSVGITGRAYLNGKIKRLLVIAPKSIVGVWQDEFGRFADFSYSLSVLQGSSIQKAEALRNISKLGLEIAVINYDSVALVESEIMKWAPDFIICDESTKIKNPSAKVSKSVYRIAKTCRYRMILTGTPIQNNPLDFFSQYKVLDDNIFGTSFYAFKNQYAVLGRYNEPIGWRKLPELVEKAHSIAYRITKQEALDLPEFIDETRYIDLEPKAVKLYKDFVKDSYTELTGGEITATNVLTRLLRLQQITGGFLKVDGEGGRTENISSAKLDALEDIVDAAVSEARKLVIIARFMPEIAAICKMLENKGITYAKISGEIRDRSAEVDRFQADKNCMVFVGQIQTVSMGITLTAASTLVFYSLSYNYADYSQARARIHRIGQKNQCLYIHLIAKGTVDETVMQALERKDNIAKSVVDNWKSYIK